MESYETIVIGGGQAGLTAGYYLKQQGRPFVILDANERVGDAWRNRWDSLRLFTPACFSALPGLPIDAPAVVVPDEGRAGRLLRGVRVALRVAGSDRSARRGAHEGRRSVCRHGSGARLRGRERDRGHRGASGPEGSRLRGRARSSDRAAPLARLPVAVAAPGGRRPPRRRGELGRRDRRGAGANASCLARWAEHRADSGAARDAAGTARVPGLPVPRPSRAEGGHRDRPEGRRSSRTRERR